MSNLFQPSNSSNHRPDTSNDALIAAQLQALYASLNSQEVEQFFQGYSAWQMRQRMGDLQTQLDLVEQRINDNAVLMQLVQPSALSLSVLTRLQSYGVEDIDLLDSMLERGDEWLDHTMRQLTQCEHLNLIHDNYTEWCRYALEGAYNWLDSIDESSAVALPASPSLQASQNAVDTPDVTDSPDIADTSGTTNVEGEEAAELLLSKLMDEEEIVKTPTCDTAQPIEHEGDVQETRHAEAVSTKQEVSSGEIEAASPDEQESSTQKSPGRGLLARVLARVWNVG